MKNTNLTQEQIHKLYTITYRHYVENYELQTELVDHLANGIEEQWKVNPSLIFENALELEFKKFGVCGFQDVVDQRRKAMTRRYRKIVFQFFKEFFRLPKIALTLFLITIYFSILRMLSTENTPLFIWGSFLIGFLFFIYKYFELRKRIQYKFKKWLLEEIIFNQIGAFNIFAIILQLASFEIFTKGNLQNLFFQISISTLMISIYVIIYVLVITIPSKAEKLLSETYPEYKIA